jgi:hypothetical protein
LKAREGSWRRNVAVNGTAAVVCALVVLIFAVTEFTRGAWVVVVVMPVLIYGLVRTNRQYREEDAVLEEGAAAQACEANVLRRHVVVVLVDRIDLAVARAIQYARTLAPDEVRAVHFNIDQGRANALIERWQRLGLSRLPLEVIDTPDRRLGRAALELADELADGETEVSILLPRRAYRRVWNRLLHDQTADHIIDVVSQLPHVNATIVPFHVAPGVEERVAEAQARAVLSGTREAGRTVTTESLAPRAVPGSTAIAGLRWRQRAKVTGRVKSMRIQPWGGVATLELTLVDASGGTLTVAFLGRRQIAGIETGTQMVVEGVVGQHHGRLTIINPVFELLSVPDALNATG